MGFAICCTLGTRNRAVGSFVDVFLCYFSYWDFFNNVFPFCFPPTSSFCLLVQIHFLVPSWGRGNGWNRELIQLKDSAAESEVLCTFVFHAATELSDTWLD